MSYQSCNFWELIGVVRGEKTLKVPSQSLFTDFTSDLTHFLVNIGGVQLNIGSVEALPKRYKITPMCHTKHRKILIN